MIAVGMTGCSRPTTVDDPSKLTRANYDAIQNNMTRPQVINLIGEPGSCRDKTSNEEDSEGKYTLSIEICWWGQETNSTTKPFTTVYFEDGVVYKKEMGNLK